MSEQTSSKINRLLRELGDTDIVSARWLRAQGYSTSLVARYVRSGWLVSPARGAYSSPRARLHWAGVVQSLQQREHLRLHVGGRFALAWRGHEHYLRLGESAPITLYGADRLPGWAVKLPIPEVMVHCGSGPFAPMSVRLTSEADDAQLFEHGLQREIDGTGGAMVIMASAERAMLELCDDKPGTALILEADAVMQGLTGLRPDLVTRLLRQCRSVKAKRLFLALAERNRHPWLARVPLADVDLGSGKRVLAKGGRLHPKYLITLPEALDENLG
jgi:hypothetical protein